MTYLYRHYDKNGMLLYVGVSQSFVQRTKQHLRLSHWSDDIATIKIERFETRDAAFWAEVDAIATEKPLYNKYAVTHDATP